MHRGWELTKKSWRLLRGHRELFAYPVLGGLAALVPTVLVVFPGVYLFERNEHVPGAALVVVGGYVATFLGIHFNVGLVAAADRILHGGQASLSDGLGADHLPGGAGHRAGGIGPVQAVKRSASLFRQRWGAQVTGNVAIGGAVVLFGVLRAVFGVAAHRRAPARRGIH